MKITIGIVDDHQLFTKSLGLMLSSFNDYSVVIEAVNGKDLQQKMQSAKLLPQIMLIDVNMPVMDGVESASWLHINYPDIKLVALSVNNSENTIINMIRAGCCAYLLKDIHPDELEKALNEINSKGFYNADTSNINYRRLILYEDKKKSLNVNEKEKQFLQLACSEMNYKEISEIMGMSERSLDVIKEKLYDKLNVHTRVGLVLEALKWDLIKLS